MAIRVGLCIVYVIPYPLKLSFSKKKEGQPALLQNIVIMIGAFKE